MDRLKKVICIGLSVVLLTGCGGRYLSSGEEGTVSGGAVSGGSVAENVVSGSSVDGKESTESTGKGISGRFCTDTNLYFGSEYHNIYWGEGVVQTHLDGTHVQKIKLKDFDFLIGVADGWLYYACYIEEQGVEEGICRVPIRKENGYDLVEPDRAERLVEIEDPDYILIAECVCLVGDSLYYCFCPELKKNDVILGRFDLKTGKKYSKRIIDGGKDGLLIDAGERVYVATDAGLYTQRINESDWTLLSDRRLGDLLTGEDIQICTGKACYYGPFDGRGIIPELRRIDAETGEDTLFTSEETLCGAVRNSEGMEGAEKLSGWIDSVYYDEGRIWILAQINWMENGVYHMEYRVFSQGEEETGLQYEEELTGCMHDHGFVRTGKWKITDDKDKEITVKEHVEINESILYAVKSGRAFMALYDGEKKRYRVGYYEIGTGKFHWLTNRDHIFYEPAVSGRYQNDNSWDFLSVYDDEPYRKVYLAFEKDEWEICDNMMYEIDAGEDGFFEESN